MEHFLFEIKDHDGHKVYVPARMTVWFNVIKFAEWCPLADEWEEIFLLDPPGRVVGKRLRIVAKARCRIRYGKEKEKWIITGVYRLVR